MLREAGYQGSRVCMPMSMVLGGPACGQKQERSEAACSRTEGGWGMSLGGTRGTAEQGCGSRCVPHIYFVAATRLLGW